MLEVVLRPNGDGGGVRFAYLRELCGKDELSLQRATPTAASELVLRLLVEAPGASIGPATGWALTLADRDALIAALHARYFGNQIEGRSSCSECRQLFEVRFDLDRLLTERQSHEVVASELHGARVDSDGYYSLIDGTRFRLPQIQDERALTGMPPEASHRALLARCRIGNEGRTSDDELERVLSALCPVLDFELAATCAECGAPQVVTFDLVSFFLRALLRERPLLSAEVHRLATRYHWSFDEILSLPRDRRHAQVALIEAERESYREAG